MDNAATQKAIDKFYHAHGECCAGCDHWEWMNSVSGNCTKSNIMSSDDRASMIGIKSLSANLEAGHAVTSRSFVCGNFIDTFDWNSHT